MEARGTSTSTGDGLLSRMALNDNKAGMEGLDRDKINKIIIESSKGSRFYENELKKEQQVNQRIDRMMLQKAQITEQQLRKAQAQVEKMASDLERSRDLSRVIVHVDMDAFYAAVEMKDYPDLKDKPMAVGSMSMLSTSNYHARRFGVRAAMPGFIAKKLCPNLVIVPANFDKYRAVSTEVREIFADYDPHFLPMSLDEAYLDISEHLEQRRSWPESRRTQPLHTNTTGTGPGTVEEGHGEAVVEEVEGFSPVLFEDSPSSSPSLPEAAGPGGGDAAAVVFGTCAEEAVREMRFRIEQRTSLTASAGIAPNMMIAKVCSDKNKPNGQYRLPSDRQAVMDFIQDLPVRKVSGIGKVTERMLGALGVTSCAHLGQEMALVSLLFSETSWHHFLQISLGLGSTHIERDGERKSLSIERTFGEMCVVEEQFSLCRELCQDLAKDLKKEGLKGKTVTLKLKNVNFGLKSRALTLPCAVATAEEIFAVAKDLLKTEVDNVSPQPLRLRLMGVRISTFVSSDDKKPLQKSIVGFLGGPSHQDPSQKNGKEPPLQPLVQSQTPPSSSACPPLVHETQEPQRQQGESLLWLPSRRGVEVGKSGQEQQSFFQKAHTQRLRLQAENGGTPGGGAGDEEEPSATTPSVGTHIQLLDSSIKTHNNLTSILAHSDKTTTAITSGHSEVSTEAHTSSNASAHCSTDKGSRSESLTCPVCFQEVRTTYLNVFNRHIDQCLSGVSATETNRQTDADTKPRADMELERGNSGWGEEGVWREREECEERLKDEGKNMVDGEKRKRKRRRKEGVVIQEDGGSLLRLTDSSPGVDQSETTTGPGLCETSFPNISSQNSMGLNPVLLDTTLDKGVFVANRQDSHPDGNNLKEHRVLEDSSNGVSRVGEIASTMTSLKSHKHEARGPVLTCPVCQETQDTDDLTLFNQHVDLCLNQDVLHELEGGLAVVGSTSLFIGTAHSREKERDRPLPRDGTANKGKSKRRASSPPPHSKKAKALGPCNTIDKFFR